jgi:hypothetical protein
VVTVKTRVDAGFPERCTLYPPHYPPAVQTTRWFLVAPAADRFNSLGFNSLSFNSFIFSGLIMAT